MKTDVRVLEDLPGRFSLLGWVQLVLGLTCGGKSRLACRTHAYYPKVVATPVADSLK